MIAIIDYKAGNLTSVERAVRHLGHDAVVTNDHDTIRAAERIIFPGVGAAGQAMADLTALGLDQALREAMAKQTPLLGICLGTQIIFDFSEENLTTCLGLIPGRVKQFPDPLTDADGNRLKVPHMGWNRVAFTGNHPVFADLRPEFEYYFVHTYYPAVAPGHEGLVAGTTTHGITFASAVAKGSLVAVQFHPEKSGRAGLTLLENFCNWRPSC